MYLYCFYTSTKVIIRTLYTKYPVVARGLGLATAFIQSVLASKGILRTNQNFVQCCFYKELEIRVY